MTGTFSDGTCCDGSFCDGTFCDGSFCDGTFSDGSLCRCTPAEPGSAGPYCFIGYGPGVLGPRKIEPSLFTDYTSLADD